LRFKNLLAVRSSEGNVAFDGNQTLVNLFPKLFKDLFGVDFVPRPDTQYRFGDQSAFQLIPVDDPDAAVSP
jgi:hypothetical protein